MAPKWVNQPSMAFLETGRKLASFARSARQMTNQERSHGAKEPSGQCVTAACDQTVPFEACLQIPGQTRRDKTPLKGCLQKEGKPSLRLEEEKEKTDHLGGPPNMGIGQIRWMFLPGASDRVPGSGGTTTLNTSATGIVHVRSSGLSKQSPNMAI